MVSAWLVSSVMAKQGQFLLAGDSLQLFLGHKNLSQATQALLNSVTCAMFTKHCQSVHKPVAARNQILLEVIQ